MSDTTLVYVNGSSCIYTTDMTYTTWNSVVLPINTTGAALLCVNNTFVLLPKTGTMGLMSKDGTAWTTFRMSGLPKNLTVNGALVFGASIVLLTSGGNNIYVSDTTKAAKRLVQFSSAGTAGMKNVVKAK